MWKIKLIRKVNSRDGVQELMYDKHLSELRTILTKLIISVAKAAKITPKQIASQYSKKGIGEYADDVTKELAKVAEKLEKEFEIALNKVKKGKS